jgi:hypothetical protein
MVPTDLILAAFEQVERGVDNDDAAALLADLKRRGGELAGAGARRP